MNIGYQIVRFRYKFQDLPFLTPQPFASLWASFLTSKPLNFLTNQPDLYLCLMHKAIIAGKEFRVETDNENRSVNGKEIKADIIEIRDGKFHILVNNKSYSAEIVEIIHAEKKVTVKINQTVYHVSVRDKYDELLHELGMDNANAKHAADVKAPMPGLVLNVMVEPGQLIKKGDAIIVLEAMKMENILKASADGEVKKIHVKKGDKVEKNQVMVNLE